MNSVIKIMLMADGSFFTTKQGRKKCVNTARKQKKLKKQKTGKKFTLFYIKCKAKVKKKKTHDSYLQEKKRRAFNLM